MRISLPYHPRLAGGRVGGRGLPKLRQSEILGQIVMVENPYDSPKAGDALLDGVRHPSHASLRKRVIISGVAGLAIAGFGLALVEIGGWGPCGPSGPVAHLGGLLSIYHFMCLCVVFPAVEQFLGNLDSVALNIAFLLLVPAANWFLLTFGLLTLRARFSSKRL